MWTQGRASSAPGPEIGANAFGAIWADGVITTQSWLRRRNWALTPVPLGRAFWATLRSERSEFYVFSNPEGRENSEIHIGDASYASTHFFS